MSASKRGSGDQAKADEVSRPETPARRSFNTSNLVRENPGGALVVGAPPEFYGYALVGFIDLLGFSSRLVNEWGAEDDSPLAQFLRIKEHVTKDDPHVHFVLDVRSLLSTSLQSWRRRSQKRPMSLRWSQEI